MNFNDVYGQFVLTQKIKEEKNNIRLLHKKKCNDIINYSSEKLIYPFFADAYEFVDKIFPGRNVKKVCLYSIRGESSLKKYELEGVSGLYSVQCKVVFLSPCVKKYTISDSILPYSGVIVAHELIHYCQDFDGMLVNNAVYQEEIAYGRTIKYLADHGISLEEIKSKYLMNFSRYRNMKHAIKKVFKKNNILLKNAKENDIMKIVEKYGRELDEENIKMANSYSDKLIDKYFYGTDTKKKQLDEDVFLNSYTGIDLGF